MASFLKDIDAVRAVNWAPKHLWDVRFENNSKHKSQLPPPFDKWVPVSDVMIDEGNLDTYSFDMGNMSFEIPHATTQRMLQLTFYESEKYEILRWLRTWVNIDILNKDKQNRAHVSRLEKSVKTVHITKLDSARNPVETNSYYVFPKGALQFEGASVSAAQQYTISFVIAGQADRGDTGINAGTPNLGAANIG